MRWQSEQQEFYTSALVAMVLTLAIIVLALAMQSKIAHARDLGQWSDDETTRWMRALMQPDVPNTSCCGDADAYWCDDYRFETGRALCTISDERPDEPRGRPHVPLGTVITIPAEKLKWDKGNPTGHGLVFLSRERFVFCYVQPGGT